MGLVTKGNANPKDNCKGLYFYDVTGDYSVQNTTGFGVPNPEIADFATATLDITLPDGTVIPQIDLYPTFPNTADIGWLITNTDLGLGATDNIPSGLWNFIYTITGTFNSNAITYTFDCGIWLACNECCCVKKLEAKKNMVGDCSCDNPAMQNWIRGQGLLDSMFDAADCDQINNAQKTLTQLQALCSLSGCGCS